MKRPSARDVVDPRRIELRNVAGAAIAGELSGHTHAHVVERDQGSSVAGDVEQMDGEGSIRHFAQAVGGEYSIHRECETGLARAEPYLFPGGDPGKAGGAAPFVGQRRDIPLFVDHAQAAAIIVARGMLENATRSPVGETLRLSIQPPE